jgi:hypothetical protein
VSQYSCICLDFVEAELFFLDLFASGHVITSIMIVCGSSAVMVLIMSVVLWPNVIFRVTVLYLPDTCVVRNIHCVI